MTPKEEAKRLIDMYMKVVQETMDIFNAYTDFSFAKECATLCAERCEELAYTIPVNDAFSFRNEQVERWQQVKREIKSMKRYPE